MMGNIENLTVCVYFPSFVRHSGSGLGNSQHAIFVVPNVLTEETATAGAAREVERFGVIERARGKQGITVFR